MFNHEEIVLTFQQLLQKHLVEIWTLAKQSVETRTTQYHDSSFSISEELKFHMVCEPPNCFNGERRRGTERVMHTLLWYENEAWYIKNPAGIITAMIVGSDASGEVKLNFTNWGKFNVFDENNFFEQEDVLPYIFRITKDDVVVETE